VALTMAGICHSLPLTPTPSAQDVSYDNGTPVSHVVIGHLETGQPFVIASSSLEYLKQLEDSIHTERARLALWYPSTAHPFDGHAA
jgi:cytochrome bd-type quinol oxidase subunit 1